MDNKFSMTLRKFISIKNIGRFSNCNAVGDVTLKSYNLIFAENGRGKTTLCDVLRSAQNGDPAPIVGRRTLGSTGTPEVSILTTAGPLSFANGTWNFALPALAIFDSTFVSQNICSGDIVGLEHKRNLYRVIIGKDGVDLAHAVDELDGSIRTKTSEIRDRRYYVQSLALPGIGPEEFCALEPDAEIDAKIKAKEMELEAVRQAVQLNARAGLTELALGTPPTNLGALLSVSVEGLVGDSTERVAAHIAAHNMQGGGEAWLAEGLAYVHDTKCPFCDQSVENSQLIEAYGAYFSGEYKALKQRVADLVAQVDAAFGERALAQFERTIDQNAAASEFWSRYCPLTAPLLSVIGDRREPIGQFRKTALELLAAKASAPLEVIPASEGYLAASAAISSLQQAVATYNADVRTANSVIESKRKETRTTGLAIVEDSLRRLRAVKARHQPDGVAACQTYLRALDEKAALEKQKEEARKKLDEYTGQIIGLYEKTINNTLEDFQAGFRITGIRHAYPGGVPSSSFQIVINETSVDVGDSTTPLNRPSFRNTLSSGDRSTLALAFFLAQLTHDPELTSRIVIFDDPFSSQDSFRRDHTIEKVRKCGEACEQIIVLSHDQGFLKRLWERLVLVPSERKCLQLSRVGVRNTAILEWDIERATQHRFKADVKALAGFYNGNEGDPRDIVGKLRPVLETYCRNLFPSQFAEADMLAAIVTKIRQAGASHDLAFAVDDLDAINVYTRRYHHGESPNPATEIISDTELQGFVKKTLAIVGCT